LRDHTEEGKEIGSPSNLEIDVTLSFPAVTSKGSGARSGIAKTPGELHLRTPHLALAAV